MAIKYWGEALLLKGSQLRPSEGVDNVKLDRRVKALNGLSSLATRRVGARSAFAERLTSLERHPLRLYLMPTESAAIRLWADNWLTE